MGRFYLCGVVNDGKGYLVCDKKDYVVEYIDRDDVVPYLEAGIKIDGLTFDGDWLKFDVRENKNLPNTRRSVTFRMYRPEHYAINEDLSIEFIDITVGRDLVSNLGSRYRLGDFTGICDDEDDVFPIVPELGYKISLCKNEDEAKDVVLRYFGGFNRLIDLVKNRSNFSLDAIPPEEGEEANDLNIDYNDLYHKRLSIDEVIFDSKKHRIAG